jgi:hypothetical protein
MEGEVRLANINWKSSKYEVKQRARSFTIDVTYSAPRTQQPIDGIREVADLLESDGIASVCDFGAGTLRNTLWLLQHTLLSVVAVEFPSLVQGRPELHAAQKFGARFSHLTPHEFVTEGPIVDATLLINVINRIPAHRARQAIMDTCVGKLRPDGSLVWISDTRTLSGVPSLNDGWAIPVKNTKVHEFYRRYDIKHIRALCETHAGLKESTRLNIPHSNGIVYRRP